MSADLCLADLEKGASRSAALDGASLADLWEYALETVGGDEDEGGAWDACCDLVDRLRVDLVDLLVSRGWLTEDDR